MTEGEYKSALARIESLMGTDDPEEAKELDALADKAVAYEEEHFPIGGDALSHRHKLTVLDG